jgi:hypothetical protein
MEAMHPAYPSSPARLPKSKLMRWLAVSTALLALLILTFTLGTACHCRDEGSTDPNCSTCSICHLSHQSIEEPLTTYRAPLLGEVGEHADPAEPIFVARPVFRRLPARAPPSA